jgi:MoxR-like ATPase
VANDALPRPEVVDAAALIARLLENIELVVRGKRAEIQLVVCALLCRGHVLFEDVPGTAKTVLARGSTITTPSTRRSAHQRR